MNMNQQLDISTRDKILQLLKTKGELSAKEITEFIGITSMAVRRHINTLEKEGLIESKTIRQPMGRPTAIYHLTDQAESFFPNKYHTLTLDLLGELELDSRLRDGRPFIRTAQRIAAKEPCGKDARQDVRRKSRHLGGNPERKRVYGRA